MRECDSPGYLFVFRSCYQHKPGRGDGYGVLPYLEFCGAPVAGVTMRNEKANDRANNTGSANGPIEMLAHAFAGGQTDKRTGAEGDANSLIGMLVHGFIGGSRAFDGPGTDIAGDFPGTLQSMNEALADLPGLYFGHPGGGQGAGVFGQPAQVIADSLGLMVHMFLVFC